jgi:hypothetical protein
VLKLKYRITIIYKGAQPVSKRDLYKKVYAMLDKTTPLLTDCGELCNKACCAEGDEETGMYLFPGEEVMYSGEQPWLIIEESSLTYSSGKPVFLAICKEPCPRELRPLSCRIFPLTPYIDNSRSLVIKMDPRAVPICPLARGSSPQKIDDNFIDTVADAFRLLIKDNEIRSFILKLSLLIDEHEELVLRMAGKEKWKKRRRVVRRR